MLTIEALNQYYGGSHILRDVSLEVRAAACTVLLGRNGVGKTTLLVTLMGLTRLHCVRLSWRGGDLAALPTHRRSQAGLGWVPQERFLAAVAGGIIGAVLGIPCLGVRDDFLAITTMGINFVVEAVFLYIPFFGGAMGIGGINLPDWFGREMSKPEYFILILVVFGFLLIVDYQLGRSWIGLPGLPSGRTSRRRKPWAWMWYGLRCWPSSWAA